MKTAAATGLYVDNMRLAVTGTDYLASEAQSSLPHYWSLDVPLFLLLAWALRYRWRVSVAWSMSVLCAISLALCVRLTSVRQSVGVLQPSDAGVGARSRRLGCARRTPAPPNSAYVGARHQLGGTVGDRNHSGDLHDGDCVPLVGRIGTGCRNYSDIRRVLRPTFVQRWGSSYALHLWHWSVPVLPVAMFGGLGGWTRTGLVIAAVGLAWATYTLVENPVCRSERLRNGLRPSYALQSTVAAVALGAAALAEVLPKLATDVRIEPLTAVVRGPGLFGSSVLI
jgi:peptidoglycan/LPS O-acetylase OafA/YrhL